MCSNTTYLTFYELSPPFVKADDPLPWIGMSGKFPAAKPAKVPASARIAVIASRFNSDLTDELLDGCLERLDELGVKKDRVQVERVPGAFELPLAAKWAARGGEFAAVICLGAVVRGDTPHFDFVAGEAARGIQDVAIEQEIPVIFGVLTTNNRKQAQERIGGRHGHAGVRAAEAAVEMIAVKQRLKSRA